MKVSELTGSALDWAVAKAACIPVKLEYRPAYCVYTPVGKRSFYKFQPHINWKQGGPIIEQERPMLCCDTYGDGKWQASILRGPNAWTAYGLTPLIAAMRCFVASKLGDEVDVPEELL